MNITPDTATSLGNKLAHLELTKEEGILLHTLLSDEPEVGGFELDKSSTKLGEMRAALGPLVKVPILAGYTEVEWTYAKGENGWIIIES